MKHKNLWLLAGPPGSGKSTWARKWVENKSGAVIVSRDDIRFSLLKPEDDYFSREDEVYNTFIQRAQTMLNSPYIKDVLIDATHLSPKARKKMLNALVIPDRANVNCIYFSVPLETCIQRNSKRTGRALVPETALRNMYSGYYTPTHREGFDHIYEVDEAGDYREVSENNV